MLCSENIKRFKRQLSGSQKCFNYLRVKKKTDAQKPLSNTSVSIVDFEKSSIVFFFFFFVEMSHLFNANMSTSTVVVTKVKRGRNTRSWGVQCRATVTGGKPERRGGTIFHTRLQKPERPRRLSQT